jgi:nitrate/TMAO reductase-like tetraheme cytochrome c subunit
MAKAMPEHFNIMGALALLCAALTIIVIVAYILKRPAFTFATQAWLFLGLGVLPMGTALTGNVAGMEATKTVHFCSSCHVMLAHTGDARDARSQSLAARHSRNKMFGDASCYTCHADYGMLGAVFTKINGMHHVYGYLNEYSALTLDEALPKLELFKPFPNDNCMQCHSTTTREWLSIQDHSSSLVDVRNGEISCASQGCHGYAHPFSKAARERAHESESPRDSAPGKETP